MSKFHIHWSRRPELFRLLSGLALGTVAITGSLCFLQPFAPESTSALSESINVTLGSTDYYITLSSGDAISMSLSPTAAGGYTYGVDNVNVKTNVESGYSLYVTSENSASSALTHATSDDTIAMAAGSGGASGTPAVLGINSYGYGVDRSIIGNNNFDASYANPTASSKWAKVPAGSTDRLHISNSATGTDGSEPGDTIPVHYGVYANNGIETGVYSGTVVYSVVTAMPPSAINVSPNSVAAARGGQIINLMTGPILASSTVIDPSDVTVTIGSNNNCTVTSVDTSGGYVLTTCTLPALAAGNYDVTVAVTGYDSTTITSGLTAVTNKGLDGITDMQDATPALCNDSVAWDSTYRNEYTLTDSRDGNTYVVRKLADGNCWMSQNLRLSAESLTAAGHSTTLNSSDTDLSDSTTPSYTFTMPASAQWTAWDGTNPHVIRAQDAPVGKKTSEGGTPISEPTATYRGTYYNWAAAIAENSSSTGTSVTKTTSICPKGWKLPTGAGTIEGTSITTTNQFQTLYEAYNSNKTNMDKELHYYFGNNSATYAGHWNSGNVYVGNSGTSVAFWSSTTSTTASNAWYLDEYSNGDINPAYNSNRGLGLSVRCILAGS